MSSSPDNRLPEVDSLPDGFVEGSADTAETPFCPDYKDSLAEIERSESALTYEVTPVGEGDDNDRVEHPVGDDGLGSPNGMAIVVPQTEGESSICSARGNSDQGEIEGCLELHTSQVVDRSSEPEYLKNKKIDTSETKRKVKKSNLRQEKELLELALKYQNVITERDAAVAVREKLESLCRELQRQNKLLMEECQRVSIEGQNIRSDLSVKFKDTIKDVSSKLEGQKEECLSQFKENELLRNKLKHLGEQYNLAELQFEQKLKQKSLELQLADLKIQQHQDKSSREQEQMRLYLEQVTQLLETEKSLRLQLAADGEKFQQFQDALLKSNEVFETFKHEMEKMAKVIKDLKKENVFLKEKCEKSDFTLIKLVEEREATKKQIEKLKNQKEKLESLCRSLHAERKQNSIKETNSNPVNAQERISTEQTNFLL